MSRNVAILAVPFEALHRALGLPADVRIDEVRSAPDRLDVLQLRLESARLPHVPEGYVIPHVGARFRSGDASSELVWPDGSKVVP